MNKRPGQIKVTVDVGFCSFCDRTRNLRREERQLGALVRTVTSCESCHRVLSSTIGVAEADTAAESSAATAVAKPEPAAAVAAPKRDEAPKSQDVSAKPKATATKPKAAAKSNTPGKRSPRSK